jgi:hypothetical protein
VDAAVEQLRSVFRLDADALRELSLEQEEAQ